MYTSLGFKVSKYFVLFKLVKTSKKEISEFVLILLVKFILIRFFVLFWVILVH